MNIEVLASADSVAQRAADLIAAYARAAVASRGRFVMAVSGGHTPWLMLRALGTADACSVAMRRFPQVELFVNDPWRLPTKRQQDRWPQKAHEGHNMRVGIATDHGGFGLKQELVLHRREAGHEVVDVGAHSLSPGDDYPDFVIPLARAVAVCGECP